MMAYAIHLMANAVHLSEASDVHDGICSTPVGKYSTPSEALDLHDKICSTLDCKCSTPKGGSRSYIMTSAVHLMANVVHPSVAPGVR